jgi:uncharacterized protein (DUF736 family)
MEQQKTKEIELGALWLKKSKAGNNFMSGYITDGDGERINVVVFKNNFKEQGSMAPDYRVYQSNNGQQQNPPTSTKTADALSESESATVSDSNAENEDIPF